MWGKTAATVPSDGVKCGSNTNVKHGYIQGPGSVQQRHGFNCDSTTRQEYVGTPAHLPPPPPLSHPRPCIPHQLAPRPHPHTRLVCTRPRYGLVPVGSDVAACPTSGLSCSSHKCLTQYLWKVWLVSPSACFCHPTTTVPTCTDTPCPSWRSSRRAATHTASSRRHTAPLQ